MRKSFEILGVITKEHPKRIIGEDKYNYLTKGFESHRYYDSFKVLHENSVYSLNNNYKINYEDRNLVSVEENTIPFDLYSYGSPKIQVNAIVGKNGSGKSTLSEILYLMLYNIAVDKRLIHDPEDELITDYKGFLNAILLLKHDEEFISIDFEVLNFFEWEHSQKKDSKNIRYYRKKGQGGRCQFEIDKLKGSNFKIDDLFYMISMNYSLYGLNEKKMGPWIKHIFHKNDMYTTPIVINPYRDDGNIDVNTEDTQNTARAISNLSQRNKDLRVVTLSPDYKFDHLNVIYQKANRKQAYLTGQLKEYIKKNLRVQTGKPLEQDYIDFKSNYSPFDFFNPPPEPDKEPNIFESQTINFPIKTPFETNHLEIQQIASVLLHNSKDSFNIIHKYFYNISDHKDLNEIIQNLKIKDGKYIIEDLFSYFICKLYRIGINYPEKYGSLLNTDKNGFSDAKKFEEALFQTLTSNSHACFKLKRVYFFLNFSKGKESIDFVFDTQNENNIVWKLEGVSNERPDNLHYRNILNETFPRPEYTNDRFYEIDDHFFLKNDIAWRIPPPIFETNLIVEKIDSKGRKQDLNILSSGETQFIYTLQTILYHIINIDSNGDYKNIVLLLDEIELYHHPEYQRVFLSTLLKQINELKLTIENIQIILLTHSPFILSDIPASNILKLKDGIPESNSKQTFAANIYDLLKDDFFLEKGVIGEFASKKIQDVLGSNSDNYEECIQIIDLIGDPLLKSVVSEKFNGKIRDEQILQRQIDKLNNQLKKIRNAPDQGV